MVSLAISVLVISTLTVAMLSMNKVRSSIAGLMRHIELANDVIRLFDYEFAKAGQLGCNVVSSALRVKPYLNYGLTPEMAFDHTGDSLSFSYMLSAGSQLIKKVNSVYYFDTSDAFKKGDIVIISDCQHAEINQLELANKKLSLLKVRLRAKVGIKTTPAVQIGRLISHTYYTNKALYVENLSHVKKVRIPNIYHLNVKEAEGVFSISFDTVVNGVTKHWAASFARGDQ